jgi:hypothetical protein
MKQHWLVLLSTILLQIVISGCQESGEEVISPEVMKISPSEGEALFSSLEVVFNKPMAVETIKITVGGVEGQITFNEKHTEFVWIPQKLALLSPGPNLVQIKGEDKHGRPLVDYRPITVNVVIGEIEPIEITRITPNPNQPVDPGLSQMTVRFSEGVDPSESTVSVFSETGKSISIDLSWKTESVEIAFKENLETQTTYTVAIFNLLDAGGFQTAKLEFRFTTQ